VGTRLEGVAGGTTAVLSLEGVTEALAGLVVAGVLHTVLSIVPIAWVHVDGPTVVQGASPTDGGQKS
jgi:hypothetical protein